MDEVPEDAGGHPPPRLVLVLSHLVLPLGHGGVAVPEELRDPVEGVRRHVEGRQTDALVKRNFRLAAPGEPEGSIGLLQQCLQGISRPVGVTGHVEGVPDRPVVARLEVAVLKLLAVLALSLAADDLALARTVPALEAEQREAGLVVMDGAAVARVERDDEVGVVDVPAGILDHPAEVVHINGLDGPLLGDLDLHLFDAGVADHVLEQIVPRGSFIPGEELDSLRPVVVVLFVIGHGRRGSIRRGIYKQKEDL